ncbi:MAG TPA: hypothetical protein VLH85_02675 [Levilinea sp.]|nr:hypothetical protein [Levilinea sp.]
MIKTVDQFINNYEGEKKAWLTIFASFMRENYPEIPEAISYQIPTWKFHRTYIAFSAANEHFTFHTLDFEMIEELKTLLPKVKFGKGSAKVPYASRESIPILFDMIHKIVRRNR